MLDMLHIILENIVDGAILLFEFIGVGIIIFSGIRGFFLYIRRSPDTKLTLAKGLAMGLEFKLGSEILRTVEIFRCKVVDVSSSEMTIEATGDHDKLDAILSLLHRFGIKEVARTGSVAMRRSKKCE